MLNILTKTTELKKNKIMQKSESIISISKAILLVMEQVKGIEKRMTVGEGTTAYAGVSDFDVKKTIGDAMQKNGLALLPVDYQTKVTNVTVNGIPQFFTEVTAEYMLTHSSGEFIMVKGYGHGTDSMDKSAGKATTYAMKYALLYLFCVPTGSIDDADKNHSQSKKKEETFTGVKKKKQAMKSKTDEKPKMI